MGLIGLIGPGLMGLRGLGLIGLGLMGLIGLIGLGGLIGLRGLFSLWSLGEVRKPKRQESTRPPRFHNIERCLSKKNARDQDGSLPCTMGCAQALGKSAIRYVGRCQSSWIYDETMTPQAHMYALFYTGASFPT